MEKSLKEKTAHGLFWGGISTGLQQVLNLLFGVLLVRILNADDYGMIGMLTIFSLIAGTLQESGFTSALINKKQVTHKDYNAVFWASVLIGCSIYFILFLCAPFIAAFYGKPELTPLARFVFIGFVITSTGTAHNAVLFKKMMVRQKAVAQLSALVISGTVGVVMAYHGMAYWGLAVQNLLYVTTLMSIYWYFSPWKPSFQIDFKPLKGLFGFSSRMLMTHLFTHINNNIFSVILGRFFSTASVGFYTQANKWNMMGYSIITGMVNGVAHPVFSTVAEDIERQKIVFRKMLRFTAFISFPCMLGLGLIAKEFILIAATEKWLPSVPILQLLSVWGAFIPVSLLFSNLIVSRGKSNIYMWNTILLGLSQLLLLLLTYPLGIHWMIVGFVTINIAWVGVWFYFVRREIGLTLMELLKDLLPFALSALGVMLLTYWITHTIVDQFLLLFAKIGLAAILYLLILWLGNAQILKDCIQYFFSKKIS